MSLYNYFCSNSPSTDSEKENAAALKVMLKERKGALKVESKKFEAEYKKTVKEAKLEYKKTKAQAKEQLHRNLFNTAKGEVDALMATEEFAGADAKTKNKMEEFRKWMNEWKSSKFSQSENEGSSEDDDEDEEMVVEEVKVIYPDEKKIPLP